MTILAKLQNNKGTVSSALGKELAIKVLNGESVILSEAIDLVNYEPNNVKAKNVRAGAAKIIEKVCEKKPELMAPHLEKILPALSLPEPQTRWMLIMALGYCAHLNQKIALKGTRFAKNYLQENQGVCLSGAAAIYLGHIGALSVKAAKQVFPILSNALDNASVNEVDWILEALLKISANLNIAGKKIIVNYAKSFLGAPKNITRKRAGKIIQMLDKKD